MVSSLNNFLLNIWMNYVGKKTNPTHYIFKFKKISIHNTFKIWDIKINLWCQELEVRIGCSKLFKFNIAVTKKGSLLHIFKYPFHRHSNRHWTPHVLWSQTFSVAEISSSHEDQEMWLNMFHYDGSVDQESFCLWYDGIFWNGETIYNYKCMLL